MISLAGRVTEGLAALLEKGAFLPGEALPSPEELARRMILNPVAVRQAYAALEDQGLLERRQESGYYVRERGEEP